MPLPQYGVLLGTLNRFVRENPNNYGSWYHGKMYIDTPSGQYECAVDVSTPSGIGVQYRVIHNLDKKLLAPVLTLSSGWHNLAKTPTSVAIDYIRDPLFRKYIRIFTFLPDPWLISLISCLNRIINQWIDSTGDNALNALEACLNGCTRVFVYGAPYTSGLGVHDIHMNQGDPPGQFQDLDGIWQDGGTIVERPNGEYVACLTKFETQSLNTDNNGLPI